MTGKDHMPDGDFLGKKEAVFLKLDQISFSYSGKKSAVLSGVSLSFSRKGIRCV